MASTYENDLRLEEMATGENSGSWGTKTNTNLELIADAFSYGTETIANADTTITIADGAADAARSLALKINSSEDLTTTRVVTLAPNTTSKVWIIENNTSGGQTLTISAGSGSNITLANGKTKIIATDGIGAGSNVIELTQDIAIADLFVDDDLTVGDDIIMDSDGGILKIGADADLQVTHSGSAGTITNATGDLTLDVAGDIILDADGADIKLLNGGTHWGSLYTNSTPNNLYLQNMVSDGDIYLSGSDGGVAINALTLDMSQAGRATFNEGIVLKSSTGGDFGVNINTASGDSMKLQVVDTGTAGAADGVITVSDGDLQLNASGGVVVNESGADADFRVESNSNANMLFVDAGVSQIGVGMVPDQSWGSNSQGINFGINTADAGWLGWQQIAGADNFNMMWNVYHDNSNFRYASNNPAAKYTQNSTSHTFSHAANGSADAVISFVENLRMNSTEAAFNEASADLDFRVESDNYSHMLFVNAGTDVVTIGGSDVGTHAGMFNVAGDLSVITGSGNPKLTIKTGGTGNNPGIDYRAGDNIVFDNTLIASAATDYWRVGHGSSGSVTSEVLAVTTDSRVGINDTTPSYTVDVRQLSNSAFDGVNLQPNNQTQNMQYSFLGTTSTYFTEFMVDSADSGTAGYRYFKFYEGTRDTNGELLYLGYNGTVFNEAAGDRDFRVESDNDNHAIFLDAGNDRVGIMNNNPAYTFSVAGKIQASQSVRIDSNAGGEALITAKHNGNSSDFLQTRDSSNNLVHALLASGGATFNENSEGTADFRVESNDQTHMFFVDSGENAVLMGLATAASGGFNSTTKFVMNGTSSYVLGLRSTNSTSTGLALVNFRDGDDQQMGQITGNASANTVTYGTSSDRSLKENDRPIPNPVDRVKSLNPVLFDWISDGTSSEGFIAQELEQDTQLGIDTVAGEDGEKNVDYGRLTPLLTAALKEAITKIEDLEARITALENA